MSFALRTYHHPDFDQSCFKNAPDAVFVEVQKDGVAPVGYHATTIFPEYFKIQGKWQLLQDGLMDCVAVYHDGRVDAVEFRNLHVGDLVAVGRREDGSQGIYVWPDGFDEKMDGNSDIFAFRQRRSRETAFSKDYDELYDLLRYEKQHGHIVWVMGPACAFDASSRKAFEKLVNNGYVHALLAGNALSTHDLEGAWLHTALGQNIYKQ